MTLKTMKSVLHEIERLYRYSRRLMKRLASAQLTAPFVLEFRLKEFRHLSEDTLEEVAREMLEHWDLAGYGDDHFTAVSGEYRVGDAVVVGFFTVSLDYDHGVIRITLSVEGYLAGSSDRKSF